MDQRVNHNVARGVSILEEGTAPGKHDIRTMPFSGPIAWTGESLDPRDGMIAIDAECRRELDRLVETLNANPMPTALLDVAEFDLPACRRVMRQAKASLEEG